MAVTAPCAPWADLSDVADLCAGNDCVDLDPYILDDSLADASFLLNAWSAFQYQGGKEGCSVQVRPVPEYGPAHSVPEWGPGPGPGGWNPAMWTAGAGGWSVPVGWLDTNGWGFCGCGSTSPLARRSCNGGPSQVGLGWYPLNSIIEVVVNGTTLDPDMYRIDDQRWLVRVKAADESGTPHWPYKQDLSRPAGEDHTWTVEANVGALVPAIGTRAAVDLACAIARERCGGDCLLAPGVTNISREGVTMQLVRPTEEILDSMPASVRTFLNAVNPGGLRRRPRVFSPDVRREAVTPGVYPSVP